MEFVEVVKQRQRMCKTVKLCVHCPLGQNNNGTELSCVDLIRNRTKEAEKIIMKWAKENPIKTNRQVLEEVLKEKFGDIFDASQFDCLVFKARNCSIECSECNYRTFWDEEYKEVSNNAD